MSLNQIFLTAAELVSRDTKLRGEYRHTHIPCCTAINRAGCAHRARVAEIGAARGLLDLYFNPDTGISYWFGEPFPLGDYWHIPRKEKSRVRKAKEQRIYALLLLAEISKDLD